MTAAMEKDTFIIRHHCGIGFEAQIRRADGSTLTGLAFRDEAAARAWVAKHAPDAEEVVRRSP
jgi:hypothetical protein